MSDWQDYIGKVTCGDNMFDCVVLSFSGGKDSTAALLWVAENFRHLPVYPVWADTGWEHPGLEEWNRRIVRQIGYDLVIVRNRMTFHDMVRRYGGFPHPSCRECTNRLKKEPIRKYIRSLPHTNIIIVYGLRAEESQSRSVMESFRINPNLTTRTRTVYDLLPIHHWLEQQVKDYVLAHGLPLHPIYSYLSRLSCRLCIFARRPEIDRIEYHDPKAIDIIESLEDEIGRTMKPGGGIRNPQMKLFNFQTYAGNPRTGHS